LDAATVLRMTFDIKSTENDRIFKRNHAKVAANLTESIQSGNLKIEQPGFLGTSLGNGCLDGVLLTPDGQELSAKPKDMVMKLVRSAEFVLGAWRKDPSIVPPANPSLNRFVEAGLAVRPVAAAGGSERDAVGVAVSDRKTPRVSSRCLHTWT
jgi:hypothetical protein